MQSLNRISSGPRNAGFFFMHFLAAAMFAMTACSPPDTYNSGDPGSSDFYLTRLIECVRDKKVCPIAGISGTVTGLAGSLQLRLNGSESLTITSAGSFGFTSLSRPGEVYDVTITSQPTGQLCAVSGGTGVVSLEGTNAGLNIACKTVLYAAGTFTTFNGQTANRIARLNADGSLDTGFDAGAGLAGGGAQPYDMAAAGDGSGDIYVGGDFATFNGAASANFVRIKSDGTRDTTFDTGTSFNNIVWAVAATTDGSGKIYAGGDFTSYNGAAANRIVRLNRDGTIDAAFNPGTGFSSTVRAIVPLSDGTGRIYVGGHFTVYQGNTANYMIRLNADGSRDSSFGGTGANIIVSTVALAPNNTGAVYVGGNFTFYNGGPANRLVRLNADGTTDTTFDISGGGADGSVQDIFASNDGSGDVYITGGFSNYNGTAASTAIIRANSNGTLDTTFNPGTGIGGAVNDVSMYIDGSGSIRVGGLFTSYNSATHNRLVNVRSDGAVDAGVNIGTGFNGTVHALLP